jgi:hypothetical protein
MKNGKRFLLTFLPKYDKLIETTYKEKKVDYPIPATVTEYTRGTPTFGAELYDANKTLIIKKGYYYASPANIEYAEVNADDISKTYWRVDALTETNNRNSKAYDKLKDYLVENFEEIGEEHANEIANIMGIELSKSVEVEFNVTIKATITIPVNEEVADISTYDFDVEISSNSNDYEIEEYDADIDSIDERY